MTQTAWIRLGVVASAALAALVGYTIYSAWSPVWQQAYEANAGICTLGVRMEPNFDAQACYDKQGDLTDGFVPFPWIRLVGSIGLTLGIVWGLIGGAIWIAAANSPNSASDND